METALQQAISKLRTEMMGWTGFPLVYACYQRNIEYLQSLIPAEKEQIKKAWRDGESSNEDGAHAEQYYSQTYQSK